MSNKITIEHRKELMRSLAELADHYDKYLLTFATGGLYLSIFFIKDVQTTLIYKGLLLTSWILIALTILFSLLSLLIGMKAFYAEIGNLDNDRPQSNCLNVVIIILNILSLITFFSGAIFLITFYYLNLK